MNIKKRHLSGSALLTILLLFLACFALPKNLAAQSPPQPPVSPEEDAWQATITVTSVDLNVQTVEVVFGVKPQSTDGFDSGIDIVGDQIGESPAKLPYLSAYFISGGDRKKPLQTDIRPAGPWTLKIDSNRDLTLNLDVSSVPSDVSIVLEPDISGDVMEAGSYKIIIKSGAQITSVFPETGGVGTGIAVEGKDFEPGESVAISLGEKVVATVEAKEDGSIEATFTVDAPQKEGDVTIKAKGETSGREAPATFTYTKPMIDTVDVAVNGKIVVTMEGEAKGTATFTIDGVTEEDVEMVEGPEGTYVGSFSPRGQIEDATVTVTLGDGLNEPDIDDTQTVDVDMILFELPLYKGINMISVPLANAIVKVGDGEFSENPIIHPSDLFEALGDAVSLIIYYDTEVKEFRSYTPITEKGSPVDIFDIEGDVGLIVNMTEDTNITFGGTAWPGDINLVGGINLIGVPLDDPSLTKLSDLAGKLGEDLQNIVSFNQDKKAFSSYTEEDIDITGGLGLILKMEITGDPSPLILEGDPWLNPPSGGEAAPANLLPSFDPTATPALAVDGTLIHEVTGAALNELSVIVRNLSTGVSLTDTTGSIAGNGRFSITFVNINGYVAKVGDALEVNVIAQDGNFRVEPIRYTLAETDIASSRVALGNLIANVIPSSSELLCNFPNPFNPETWIPFKLAETADAVITIYDVYGHLVRTIDLGHLPAGLYSAKAKAAYWNGANAAGERVASGVYFYHIQAGKFSATRRMVILK